jgi:hypothetical protein
MTLLVSLGVSDEFLHSQLLGSEYPKSHRDSARFEVNLSQRQARMMEWSTYEGAGLSPIDNDEDGPMAERSDDEG